MARLRRESPIVNQSSDESEFSPTEGGAAKHRAATDVAAKVRTSPRKTKPRSYRVDERSASDESAHKESSTIKPKTPTHQRSRQIRLAPLNYGFLSISKRLEPLQLRNVAPTVPNVATSPPNRSPIITSDVAESLWCGSDRSSQDSEEELPSPRKFMLLPPKKSSPQSRIGSSEPSHLAGIHEPAQSSSQSAPDQLVGTKPASSRPGSSSDKENNGAFLRFSPPHLHSPRKQCATERPVTPPQSPSKSRLQSPSKTKFRAPTPPLRQSLDTFWNSNAVNDWNDQYSPQKILKSPKKLKFLEDEALQPPTASPRKAQSPSKVTRIEREAKKDFDSRKRTVAEAFFHELDQVVTEGKIQELSASTGGVQFIWSKTLNSTAGRANWRKETSHIRILDGTTEVRHKHHASIELAEKVIDDENRLLNVIAHEFCHLANFMVSGIKNEPHGRQFKAWGRKCTAAFKDRGVEVTMKHSYQIEYKYIWQCSSEDCAVEFKRHSKSIDPKRHTCGTCRSKLVQIKPTPRRDAGTATGYAAYVKAHFANVKRSMPQASQKEVMGAVGKKYRAEKASTDLPPVGETTQSGDNIALDMDAVAKRLEVVVLDDD